MAKYDFDSFDEGAKAAQAEAPAETPKYDLSAFDAAHDDHAKQYAPEDQSKVSDMEAAGLNWGGPVTGIKQGATLGFGDEIAAISGAAGAKSGGDKRPFWDIYKDILDSTRAEQKQVQEDHPISTTAGELAGGFVSPLGLVGGAAAGGAAPAASFLSKAGQMAKIGAIGGAAIGLGNSEADLTSGDSDQVLQAAKDTGGGAVAGGLLGAATQSGISAVGAVGRGVGKIVNKMPVTEDIMAVFNKTRAGQELLGQAKNFSKQNRDLSHEIIDGLGEIQQMARQFKGGHEAELNNSSATVDLKAAVDKIRAKIAQLDPVKESEIKEVEAAKSMLSKMLDEQEQTVTSFIKKPTNPNLIDAETKAERTVAQKTAEAEVKDSMRVAQLEDAIAAETGSDKPNEKEIARLTKLLKKAQGSSNTQFPAQTIVDDVTGLPVKAVDRGMGKSPIASAVLDDVEPLYTPLQKMQRSETVIGRPTTTVPKANALASSADEGIGEATTAVGKQAYGAAKDELKSGIQDALSNAQPGPGMRPIADSVAGINEANSNFYNTSNAKRVLGIDKMYGPLDQTEKTAAVNKIQNMIRDYHQGGQKSQQIEEALGYLEQAYPDTAKMLRQQIAEGSQNEYLANELSRGSEFARDPRKILASGKAALLQGARVAGKGANTADNAAKAITNLGKNVYNSSPQALQSMAQHAAATGQPFAKALSQIANAPDAKRKALMFTLMQQENFRNFAKEIVGDGDSDK